MCPEGKWTRMFSLRGVFRSYLAPNNHDGRRCGGAWDTVIEHTGVAAWSSPRTGCQRQYAPGVEFAIGYVKDNSPSRPISESRITKADLGSSTRVVTLG